VATWRRLEGSVPLATLNLGIDAQVRQRNASEAVSAYHRYLATGGPRAATVREWKERLQTLYGVAAPTTHELGTATATETTP